MPRTSFLFAALLLAGCAPLDAIEGKSTSKDAQERRMALLMPVPAVAAVEAIVRATVAPEPTPEPVEVLWPVVLDTSPACVPVFRVSVCP